EPGELAVLQEPADVQRRPALGVPVLRPHEAQEPGFGPGVTEDVLQAPPAALTFDLPPARAAGIEDPVLAAHVLRLLALAMAAAARAPGAITHRIAVNGDLLAVELQLAHHVAELVEVRIVQRRRLARREALRRVDRPVLELDRDVPLRVAVG